jgi:signal transduction histidine kinase
VADQEKHLQSLLSNTRLLKELIDKTSTYCRLRFDVVTPVLQQVEINEFLKNLQIEASEWPECRHRFVFESKDTPQVCLLDSFQIKTVLENLLRNAMHFSEPGTTIGLTWNVVDSALEITIEDQGVGIPEKDWGQVFDPYFRTRDLAGNTGTGLGLTICRQIVEKNKGTITLTNNQPTGTAVKIILPS